MNHLDFYKKKFNLYGDNVKSLGWGSTKSQEERFKLLSEIGILSGDSVLDIGCAFGDFCKFLKTRQLEINYTGVDANKEFISLALERKYKNSNFILGDIFSVEGDYDWVTCSGIFALDQKDWLKNVLSTIHKMFDVCKKGVAANFLSSMSSGEHKDGFMHSNPLDITAKLTPLLSNNFVIRHDYRDNDYTLYFYKNKST